jgi:biotin carboxyl carrier protein
MFQLVIRAPRDGQVEKINCHVGENVPKDAIIVKFVQDDKDGQNAV